MSQPQSNRALRLGLIGGCGCALLSIIAVAVIVLVIVMGGGDSTPTTEPEDDTAAGELVAPPGVGADQPYLELSTSSDGPEVDVYIDFLCPHCATFHDAQGEDLAQLAEEAAITLRIHPRPMLDASSTPEGYSGRAANAAVCAYAEGDGSAENWIAAEQVLFENQPGAEGIEDGELVSLVDGAAGTDIADCVADSTYLPWIQDVVEPEAQGAVPGTPAVLIDGAAFEGDPAEAGSVRAAIEAA